jgi:hypothetical protein
MKILLVVVCLALLSGCGSLGGSDRTIFDRLEFGDDECGTFKISGTVDTNPNPFAAANVHAELYKEKACPE